jgi:hypothetical protein
MVAASGIGSGISDLLSSRITRLGGYLIYSNREPGYISQVPWLLPILLSGLGLGLRWLLLILRIGPLKY